MKLESKLGLSTGFLIAAMFLSAYTAHLRMAEATRLSDVITANRLPLIMGSRDLRSHFTDTIRALESYMLFGIDPSSSVAYRNARHEQFEQAETSLAKLRQDSAHFDLGPDAQRLAALEEGLAALKPLEEKVEALNESKTSQGTAQAYDTLQNQILPLEKISLQKRHGSRPVADDSDERRARTAFAAPTIPRCSLSGSRPFSALSSEALSRSSSLAASLAPSTWSQNAPTQSPPATSPAAPSTCSSNDQIGTLATAMQQMQNNLSSIIGTVVQTAGSLTGSAASMRTAGDQIHRRMDQQSQQTQQAATAMQEMSASIAEVSRHTQSAAETARNAAETAREGGTIVKQVLGSMHSIATAVSDTSATVGLLGDDSRRISQIVTVIDEIARKTNLLALNAAIEAARAGDQGRGFAVVAGEVRRLAESTAQATGEIATMIQGIQDRTRTAIASMESGTGTVEQGVVTTTQAGEALERIIGMAERVDRMIAQIAIAASQQAAAADQSSASLDAIHSLSHENLTEMATTAAGIESLRTTAVTLEQHVDRFSLKSAPDARLISTTANNQPHATLQPA